MGCAEISSFIFPQKKSKESGESNSGTLTKTV
jgi:hypothetical protein